MLRGRTDLARLSHRRALVERGVAAAAVDENTRSGPFNRFSRAALLCRRNARAVGWLLLEFYIPRGGGGTFPPTKAL